MLVNTLIFPYDNSRQILATMESLDRELIRFLEDLCDGDDQMPDARAMSRQIRKMESQLMIFSNQKLLLHLSRQKKELEIFRSCEGKAKVLVARMEVLSRMEKPGILSPENRQALEACGATVKDQRSLELFGEMDIVMNYHIRQILLLRRELLEVLSGT